MKIPFVIESEKFCRIISWFIPVAAITLYPFIVCRDKSNKVLLNHERIHIAQQQELLVIPFFIIYILNGLYNIFKFSGNIHLAYQDIIFEKEAYEYEDDLSYLKDRPLWSVFKFFY